MRWVNYMAISFIEIRKLFGKHDVVLDLSKRCNILIGPNGVGKSTILRIINSIYLQEWIELSKYNFKEVEISVVDDAKRYQFSRADLFPSLSIIKKLASKLCDDQNEDSSSSELDNSQLREECTQLLDELKKTGLIYEYLSNCYFNIEQPASIRRKTEKYDSQYNPIWGTSFDTIIKRILTDCTANGYYKHSNIKNTFNTKLSSSIEKPSIDDAAFFADMVPGYTVQNQMVLHSEFISPLLTWLSITRNDILSSKSIYLGPKTMFGQLVQATNQDYSEIFRPIFESIDDFQLKSTEGSNASFIGGTRIERVPDYFFIKELTNSRIIHINRLINRHYYDQRFVFEFNKRAIRKYVETIGNGKVPGYIEDYSIQELTKNEIDKLIAFFEDDEVDFILRRYINPILVDGNPMKLDIDALKSRDWLQHNLAAKYVFGPIHMAFYDFYHEEVESLTNNESKSDKVKLFEQLFCNYSQIKDIKIYPCGIYLNDYLVTSKKYKHLHSISIDECNIDLSLLSSGEKKILLQLALAVFIEDLVLIVDEPELSLSLVWQEKIVPDLIQKTKVKKIIIATHSPYIATDDSLSDYIVYLPTSKGE